jgi:hypothetical protein
MDSFFIVLLIAFFCIAVQYLLEVHVGSATAMYDVEAGVGSGDSMPRKCSSRQFLGKAAPLQLAAAGVPLLAWSLPAGALLVVSALLLLCLAGLSPVPSESDA